MDDIDQLLADLGAENTPEALELPAATSDGKHAREQRFDALLFLLKSEKPEVRQQAVEFLAEMRDLQAVEPLMAAL